jgi:hypothetical protein
VAEAGAGHGGARGSPFIGARGEGSSSVRWTPVRCTAAATGPHGGAVPCEDATTASEDEAVSTSLCGECRRGGGEDGGRRRSR